MADDAPGEARAPTIWVDADAAPGAVREVLFRAAERRQVRVLLVANRPQRFPKSKWIGSVEVAAGMDVADDHIAARCGPGDLVITADVPLAAACVAQGALVIDPRGEQLDERNVKQRLAVRDLMTEVRASGIETGGPPPYDKAALQRFANALDRNLTRMLPRPAR
ncbi:MAG: YaiI/YqxD family protein [Deltaproteobacteria bacterium]|nr:YaiI/YqxD family protein [Deltaproteobacteria bacterium]